MKTKQRMLTEDWELFKQRRFMEEQVRLGAGGAVHRNGNCSLRVDGSKRPALQHHTACSAHWAWQWCKLVFLLTSFSPVSLRGHPRLQSHPLGPQPPGSPHGLLLGGWRVPGLLTRVHTVKSQG